MVCPATRMCDKESAVYVEPPNFKAGAAACLIESGAAAANVGRGTAFPLLIRAVAEGVRE